MPSSVGATSSDEGEDIPIRLHDTTEKASIMKKAEDAFIVPPLQRTEASKSSSAPSKVKQGGIVGQGGIKTNQVGHKSMVDGVEDRFSEYIERAVSRIRPAPTGMVGVQRDSFQQQGLKLHRPV
ncbi:hypothetical protein Dimus_015889 [Dionaea muscipula]